MGGSSEMSAPFWGLQGPGRAWSRLLGCNQGVTTWKTW